MKSVHGSQPGGGGAADRPLCRAPFTQLHFDPQGWVAVCSKSTHRRLGHIADGDLHAIWSGPGLAAVREGLAAQRFPDGCETCAWHARRGNVLDHPARSFDDRPWPLEPEWPSHLEFAFSNVCNLACIQCSPELSSTIRARLGLPPQPSPYDERFFAQIEPFLIHARGASFLGGEPFLQRECYRILDALIAAGIRVPVHITTNGTRLDAAVERVLAELPVNLSVSLDGVAPATIERIRVGADGARLLANVRVFAQRARERRRQLTLNFCLMRENWRELPDLFLLAQELSARVWVVPVTHPAQHSLFTLPPERLAEVAANWSARAPELLRGADGKQRRTWSALEEMLQAARAGAAPRETWSAPRRIQAALVEYARGDVGAARHELASVLSGGVAPAVAERRGAWLATAGDDAPPPASDPSAPLEERAAAVLAGVAALGRLEHAGRADGGEFARIAAQLAADAVATAAAHPGGTMATAWRLADAGFRRTALAVAESTPSDDPLRVRSLLFRSGLHLERRDADGARRLLDEAARAGDDSAEYHLRRAWLWLWVRQLDELERSLDRAEQRLRAAAAPEAWLQQELASTRRRLLLERGLPVSSPEGGS